VGTEAGEQAHRPLTGLLRRQHYVRPQAWALPPDHEISEFGALRNFKPAAFNHATVNQFTQGRRTDRKMH
jgi:hypothetical protein